MTTYFLRNFFWLVLLTNGLVFFAQAQDTARMAPPVIVKKWNSISEYAKESGADVNQLPIRTDIRKAVSLAVHNLNSQFNRDKDNEPYFYCQRRVDGTGEMRHAVEIGIPHVVGRSMLGSEIAEQNLGIPFPKDGFAIYQKYCMMSFDNPDHLNSYFKDSIRGVEMHNMREGLWSLWALIKKTDNKWAKNKAEQMLLTLKNITGEDGRWSADLAKKFITGKVGGLITDNQARMVDPLLAYYDVSKNKLALDLAKLYTKAGLEDLYDSAGRFTPFGKSSGHIHSLTSALSGITRLAVMSGDKQMIDRCEQLMKNGVSEYFSSWGWGDEVMPAHPANVISQGEINQTGDVIRTALYLGSAGKTEYYELAERYLRSMLLPAQLWKEDLAGFLQENKDARNDTEKDILNRCLGGYGFTLPNARMRDSAYPVETQDITSGGVHALAECWEHKLVRLNGSNQVNLLFDAENDDVKIKSSIPQEGKLQITVKKQTGISVRIPEWVDPGTLSIIKNGKKVKPVVMKGYVRMSKVQPKDIITLQFSVPCKTETEIVDGVTYSTTWIGNQLINIEPEGLVSKLPF